jgi:thymidine phosphorylase
VKVHRKSDAESIKRKFEYIANKFGIHIKVLLHETEEPAGKGIGPVLETRDVLQVLEQAPERPLDLEERALNLAGALLDLCIITHGSEKKIKNEFGTGKAWAKHLLTTGAALSKMKDIIEAQGGNPKITSSLLTLQIGRACANITSPRSGKVESISSKDITVIAKILGAPSQKGSGIYLHKKIGNIVRKGEPLFTLYSENMYNLREAKDSLRNFSIMKIE